MKLSILLILLAAACTSMAQETMKPPAVIYRAAPASGPVIIPAQDWPAMQKMPKAEFQKKLQDLTDRMNQTGCPVVLTSAGLTPYLMLLHASAGSAETPGRDPGLDLNFRNASGKEIRSMEFDAEFLARKSIYDLNAVKIDLHLTADGTGSVDETFEQLRHLPLPQRSHPVTFQRIELEQVTFADGSVWTPKDDSFCGIGPDRMRTIAR
jgi:hypothetical protein